MAWNDAPPTKEELQTANSADWAKEPPTPKELGVKSEPQGMLSKGLDFAKNLPESAIDLIPGMKEKRENVEAYRESPTYQNSPSGMPNVTQGQSDLAFQQAGQNAMNDPAMKVLGATSEASLLDLAKMVPGLGSKLTSLAPELDTMASKTAQEAMGMNSSKDLTTEYNPMTGKSERGSDIIKGTGTTALEQNVLKGGPSNWYDNALDALESNNQKLNPLLEATQSKIEPNLQNFVDQVGPITTKTPEIMQDVFDSIPESSQRMATIRKIGQQYTKYEGKLASAEGNLTQLNDIKRELQTAAENLSPQIYTGSGSAKAEATLYKRLGGVVRQHIEDLANAADPGAGDQIHQVNKTIGNLSNMIPSLQKTTRGGIPTSKAEFGRKMMGPLESFAAKGLNSASKTVQTPIGDLVQKSLPAVSKTLVDNPWRSSSSFSSEPPNQNSSKIAGSLYNATDESLKSMANKLGQEPGMEHTANYLSKAIDDNDQNAKNRAIFLIMQSPSSRKLVSPE